MYINKNKYVIENDICKLIIKNKDTFKEVLFDNEDLEKIKQKHWRVTKKKNKFYTISGQYKNGEKGIYLHNFLLNFTPDGINEVDHINGNSLDNRKTNLRIISRNENIQNTRVRIDNKTTGIRGISFDKRYNNYIVDFHYNKNRYYFKPTKDIEEAIYLRYLCEKHISGYIVITDQEFCSEIIKNISNNKKNTIEEYFNYILKKST